MSCDHDTAEPAGPDPRAIAVPRAACAAPSAVASARARNSLELFVDASPRLELEGVGVDEAADDEGPWAFFTFEADAPSGLPRSFSPMFGRSCRVGAQN